MDNNGGGPLGVTELLLKATTMATYLKDDWSRDWGSLQRLTPYYPNAEPARLDAGNGDAQRPVEPGAAETLRRTTHFGSSGLKRVLRACIGRRVTLEVHHR